MSELLNRPCGGRFGNIVESIGNTPLVELPRLSPKPEVRIYAKLEGRNPTGPVADSGGRASPPVRWQDGDHLRINPEAYRVIRGGAWDNEKFGLRCCERIFARARTQNKGPVSGFRVAR